MDMSFILLLPTEIQDKILDEIPQFTRLSKNKIAGKYYLDYLSSKDITRKEYNRYLYYHKPNRCYQYIQDNDVYIIIESFYKYGLHHNVKHELYFINGIFNLKITNIVNHTQIPLSYYKSNIKYDIVTTYNFYINYRKECKNPKKYILEQFNNNLPKYDDHVLKSIVSHLYICSNVFIINDDRELSAMTMSLKPTINMFNFNTKYDLVQMLNIINDHTNVKLPKIYEYLKV